MMFIINQGVSDMQVQSFRDEFEEMGYKTIFCPGTDMIAIGLIGNTNALDVCHIVETHEIIRSGTRVSEPYKLVNRLFHPNNESVIVNKVVFGEGHFQVISGPCSVESEEQIIEVARSIKKSGATILRGGAYKPRSSPYSFQGLHEEGLKLLSLAKKETGLPLITEMTNINQLKYFDDVDIIQIGARNMQNFDLLKEVGHCRKPILLKRGLYNTIDEFLMSAEYIMAGGNENIIFCERGIRTIETLTRNTLDISAIPLLKKKSFLPVIIDPSHASGIRSLVAPLSRAAIAVGADGLMIETHNNPSKALCDGAQSLDLVQFDELMKDIKRRIEFEGKVISN